MRSPTSSRPILGLWLLTLLSILLAVPGSTPLEGQEPEAIQSAIAALEFRHIGPANVGGRVSAIVGTPGVFSNRTTTAIIPRPEIF